MLDRIIDLDVILGNNAGNYTEPQKEWALKAARCEVEAYIGRTINEADGTEGSPLYSAVLDIAIIKLQRLGTEAVASQSFSGVSESFLSGYPAHIVSILNRYRRIKVIG